MVVARLGTKEKLSGKIYTNAKTLANEYAAESVHEWYHSVEDRYIEDRKSKEGYEKLLKIFNGYRDRVERRVLKILKKHGMVG